MITSVAGCSTAFGWRECGRTESSRRGGGDRSPEVALEIVERLALDDYRYLHSTRAELLRRLGRTEEARRSYHRALELSASTAERRFLERRLAEL